MKRFIEIAVALMVILGAAGARAQSSGAQTAELAPTVVSPPAHRTMAQPQFAVPVAEKPVLTKPVLRVVDPQPAAPSAVQPTPLNSTVREVRAPTVAPMHVALSAPTNVPAMAPDLKAMPLPPAPPVSLAPVGLPADAVAQAGPMTPAAMARAAMVAAAPMPIVVSPPAPAVAPPTYYAAAPVALPMTQPQTSGVTPITLEAGTGALLRLPVAAATIMSAQPTIARVQPASPTSLFLMGVGPGRTTVIAANTNGIPIAQYDVTVTPGMTAGGPVAPAVGGGGAAAKPTTLTPALAASTQAAINQTVVGAQSVHARAIGHALLLTGTVATAQMAQSAMSIAQAYIGPRFKVDDQMSVLGSIQVNVRVRIAEISRTITRQLGFNWQNFSTSATYRHSGWMLGLAGGAVAALSDATPYSIGGSTYSVFRKSRFDINGVIDALAQDNLITVLAEPNLTAQSGETASFLAGGEFPIPVAAQSGNGSPTVTIAFKQFGVSLDLVPTVLSPNRLNLRIRPEVSQLTNQGAVSVPFGNSTITIPALSVRRAETTIELGSGQSFAIAGLLQKTSVNDTNALPGLGELPVLGALFKSNAFQRGESELVIIVTPYIVRPVSDPKALRTPVDHFQPATDLGRILFGRQMARTPSGVPALDAGFILK